MAGSEGARTPHMFERPLPGALRRHALWVWLGLACLAAAPFALSYYRLVDMGADGEAAHALLALLLVPGVVYVSNLFLAPAALVVCRNVLKALGPDLDAGLADADGVAPSVWFRQAIDTAFRGDWRHVAAAAVVAIVVLCFFWHGGFFLRTNPVGLGWPLAAAIAASGAVAGAAMFAVYSGARVFWKLGRAFPVRDISRGAGLQAVGNGLLWCYLVICGVWVCYATSAALLRDGFTTWAAAPVGVFLFFSFFACLASLHGAMRRFKAEHVARLTAILREKETRYADGLSGDERAEIGFLQNELDRALAMPTWPFNRAVFAGNGAISLLAILAPPLLPLLSDYVDSPIGQIITNLLNSG